MNRMFVPLILACVAVVPVKAGMIRDCVSASDGTLTFVVDSIDCRKDLTRVYGRLEGRPNTSSRIDGVSLTPADGRLRQCTDIDGVDLNRYFQWEEDGVISVEIDFPPVRDMQSGQLTFTTPRGEGVTKWQPAHTKKKRR